MTKDRTRQRLLTTLRVVVGLIALSLPVPEPAVAQPAVRFDGPALRHALRGLAFEPPIRSAQTDWRRVERLPPGTPVTVTADGRATVSGQFVGADATTMTLTPAGQASPQTIRREEVAQLVGRISHRGSRLGAVVGAGAGVFVGLLSAGNLVYKDCGGSCTDEKWFIGASLVGMPVGGGLLGYYAVPGPRRAELIYLRRP